MPRKKKGRGGARPGAGRKPELDGAVQWAIAFTADQAAWVEQQAAERQTSRGAVLRGLVDAARGK